MDFQRMGIDAEAMAKFVQDRTDLHVSQQILNPLETHLFRSEF